MHGSRGRRVWFGLLVVAVPALWLAFGWAAASTPSTVSEQIAASEPAPNARLFASPQRIVLTGSAAMAPDSARMRLLGSGAVELPLERAVIDPGEPNRVSARLNEPLTSGYYAVVWTARDAVEGTLLAGAFPFAVGVAGPLGGVHDPNDWPQPWSAMMRWMVFLGTALAGGGFAWRGMLSTRLGSGTAAGWLSPGIMTGSALVALLATAAAPLFVGRSGHYDETLTSAAVSLLPLGWRVQAAALVLLTCLCLTLLIVGQAATMRRASVAWVGAAAAGVALAGLGLDSHVEPAARAWELGIEVVHLWTAALWFSGTVIFLAGWRGMGTDVASFRRVRWLGGLLLAIAIATGAARAAPLSLTAGGLPFGEYARVLALKVALVVGVVALGGVAMLGRRGANAFRASRFLGGQAAGAGLAALLSAVLALMAPPAVISPVTLAGVSLSQMITLDPETFGAERGVLHLLTQPALPGAQTLVVWLTDADGVPLVAAVNPVAEVTLSLLDGDAQPISRQLGVDETGTVFTGSATFEAGWQHVDVAITPQGGIASRAQFWLATPDPNVSGTGPVGPDSAEARALYARGLGSLTSLQSVRFTRRIEDGRGGLSQSEVSLREAAGERPAAFAESVIGADGEVTARQTRVGDRRWVQEDGVWDVAEPLPFLVPAGWGERYTGASGFQLGPREAVGGELSQVVTFQSPASDEPAREPTWHAWWVGLASGQVRREAMIATGRYVVMEFWDFNAPIDIRAPELDIAEDRAVRGGNASPETSPIVEP